VAQPEPEPEPAPEPAAEETPIATPEAPVEPAEVAPQPRIRTAAIDQKRAEFKKLQEEQKQKAAEDKKKAEEEKKKKEEEAKRKAAEDQKRIEEAKAQEDEAAKLADEVANIINTEESRGATTGEGGEATLGKETGQAQRLSQSQIDGLVAQIRGCINMPPGAEENDATAELLFSVDGGGNVVAQPQLLQSSDDTYARAVSRAVMRCGPYAVVAGEDVRAQFRAREF
jgi:colicin import membrane protein